MLLEVNYVKEEGTHGQVSNLFLCYYYDKTEKLLFNPAHIVRLKPSLFKYYDNEDDVAVYRKITNSCFSGAVVPEPKEALGTMIYLSNGEIFNIFENFDTIKELVEKF